MKIQYRTTFPDVASLIWLNLTKSAWQLTFIGGLSVFVAWDASHKTVMRHGYAIGVITILIMAIAIFAILCLVGLTVSMLAALSRRNKTFMTDNTLDLQEDKFFAENRYCTTEFKWDIVQKVIKTQRHIVLYVTQSAAIVVPRRAFLNTADWDAFCSFVLAHSNK